MPCILAILSGILTALGFQPYDLTGVLPFCLVPLLISLKGKKPAEGLKLGYLSGLVYFGILIWWIIPTISTYGDLPVWVSLPIFGLFVCYLALFPGLWAGVACLALGDRTLGIPWLFFLPSAWIIQEWLRSHLLTGFPWGLLAYALEPVPPLIQTADIWGPLGLSFFIVLVNVLIFKAVDISTRRPARSAWWIGAAMALIVTLWFYGNQKILLTKKQDRNYPKIDVIAVQGSIAQDKKWNPDFQNSTLEIYGNLTNNALKSIKKDLTRNKDLGLVIWPETATPFFFQEPGPLRAWMINFVKKIRIPIIFGSPAYHKTGANRVEYLNSAFLLRPDGTVSGRYDKRHLVPFGEYLPWKWVTFWARDMIPRIGNFRPGTSCAPLCYGRIRVGVLICFESIFPSLSRDSVRAGANILAVLTNDAWFGRTGAPFQHNAMSVFRAVESRRWLVRAANTGVSSLVTPWGQYTRRTGLFMPDYLTGTARLRTDLTTYSRHGDGIILGPCVLLFLISCYKLWRSWNRHRVSLKETR